MNEARSKLPHDAWKTRTSNDSARADSASPVRALERGRFRIWQRSAAILGVTAACWLASSEARADLEIGADLDVVRSLDGDNSETGGGVALRLGRSVRLPGLLVAGELKGGLDSYGGDRSTTVYTGLAGVRLGVGELFRTSVFGHLGVGQVNHEAYALQPAEDYLGLAGDVGLAFDLTLLPLIDLGVHAAYGGVPSANFDSLRAGVHATLVL